MGRALARALSKRRRAVDFRSHRGCQQKEARVTAALASACGRALMDLFRSFARPVVVEGPVVSERRVAMSLRHEAR
jgi:hypothetical protein